MQKEVILKYVGTQEQIEYALDALAKRAKWRQLTQEELDSGEIQQTKETAALLYVTAFIRNEIKQQTLKDLKIEQAQQNAIAESQLLEQTNAGLDVIEKSLVIADVIPEI